MNEKQFVTSPAFDNEGVIPVRHTGYGEDTSPELHLSELHPEARSIAIIMNDIGHPIPEFNHWVIWNIPPMTTIPEGIPCGDVADGLCKGARQGKGYGKNRYAGPKPPFGMKHRYQYHVYVLDVMLDLPQNTKKKQLLQAMQGHVLQTGSLIGRYK